MNDSGNGTVLRCEEAVERIHLLLDGEVLEERQRSELGHHLAGCAGCRETEAQLGAVQEVLRGLPQPPLPDDAYDEVLARTSHNVTRFARPRKRAFYWRAAAAAAVLAAIAWGLWPKGPSEAELNLAATQTRFVLKLTADALGKTERAVVDKVLTGEVSPALQRVPIEWPRSSAENGGRLEDEAKQQT